MDLQPDQNCRDDQSSAGSAAAGVRGGQEGSGSADSEPPDGHAGEFSSGFHSCGGKHGQFHDSGEKLGSIPLSLLNSETGPGDEASVLEELVGHL